MQVRIKNWKVYQHYKDRRPPWIKLHFRLLTSKDWACASDSERVLAIACMLIGSQSDDPEGWFEADPEYFQRVAFLHRAPDFKPLINRGFLEVLADASKPQAFDTKCSSETEAYKEETEKKNLPPSKGDGGEFEVFWEAYPKKIGKIDSRRAWVKVGGAAHLGEILAALADWKATVDWQKDSGQFIPYPATWLNKGFWKENPRLAVASKPSLEKQLRDWEVAHGQGSKPHAN